jgi:hypothetical protein
MIRGAWGVAEWGDSAWAGAGTILVIVVPVVVVSGGSLPAAITISRARSCPWCGKTLRRGLMRYRSTYECADQRTCGYVALESEVAVEN